MKKVKGEPGIYELPNGNYVVWTTAKCPKTGKMKRRKHTTNPDLTTLDEARAMRATLKRDIRGEQAEVSQRLTLGAYAEQWINRKAKRLKPNTLRTYRLALSDYIVPQLGDIYADSIIRADVEDWVVWAEELNQAIPSPEDPNQDIEVPYADATLLKWWRTLTVLLKDLAADLGINDPTHRIERPRSSRRRVRENRTLSSQQLSELLDELQEHDPSRFAEVITLAYTGLRVGELYALSFDDIDEDRQVITVNASISDGHLTDSTKTGDPREVYAPQPVLDAIREHRLEMIAAQHRGLSSGLVFPSNAGTPRDRSALTKPLRRAAKRAGIMQVVSPQVLRRTYNTLLVRGGVDRIVIRAQLGHVSEEMTERYMGVSDEDKRRAVQRVFEEGIK